MRVQILPATPEILEWLGTVGTDVSKKWIRRCVELIEYLVAHANGAAIGFLRHSHFWGEVPFMDMVYVDPTHRRGGIGSSLFRAWEQAMITSGALVLMTSSRIDEPEPQAWHLRNGFERSGAMTFGRYQAVQEIFFVKSLRLTCE